MAHLLVVVLVEQLELAVANVVPQEAVFQSKGMSDQKLFPCDDSACANLVGFDLEPAILVVEEMCLLSKDPRKQSHYCPTQEPSICGRVAAVKERVVLLAVSMQVAVNPDRSVEQLKLIFHHQFRKEHFRVVLLVRVDPLSVEVNACDGVPVIATNHSVWVQARNQKERVELAQKLGDSVVTH